jgi:CheY-like chemotaxis protein
MKKILIVDDDEMTRSSLKSILSTNKDFALDFSNDGVDAVGKIRGGHYDLVLLDLALPKIDGYEVLKSIRGIYPELPVFFVSGKADPQKVEHSLMKDKLNGFIEKPFAPAEVLDLVKKALKI